MTKQNQKRTGWDNMSKLKSMLQAKEKEYSPTEPNTKIELQRGYMDPANILMVVPKTFEIDHAMQTEFDPIDKIPDIESDGYGFIRISKEYLIKILEFLKTEPVDVESVTIGACEGKPLVLETDNYVFLLAPKMNDEPDYERKGETEWYTSCYKRDKMHKKITTPEQNINN